MVRRPIAVVVSLAVALLGAGAAHAASLQPIGNFDLPIGLSSDPGNGNRLFVAERKGQIVEFKEGVASEYADISSVVGCCNGEQGLLSVALAPDFDSSGRLYVDYTDKEEPGSIHVAELRADGSGAPFSSLRNLLTIPHPEDNSHYGGQLQFGPEGLLYISTGDGGGSDDVHHNSQDTTKLLGKILRIDPLPGDELPYTIPAGNPFPAAPAPADTVWSYGLRNPFRFSFDSLNGAIWIGDVGQAKREEIDYAPPGAPGGANYGWNCREGRIVGPATDGGCAGSEASDFVEPVFDYPHVDPGDGGAFGCAVIGGYVVRDQSLGGLYGRYLYGDFCGNEVRSLDPSNPFASDRTEGLGVESLYSFGEDSCRRLYTISGAGTISRIVGPDPAPCGDAPKGAGAPTYVGLTALHRKVKRNSRAQLTAWISPCRGHVGEPVKLLRNGNHVATRRLNRACTVHFRPRISRGAGFRATIRENAGSQAGASRQLKIRIARHQRAR